jgi:RNA polymerase sigma-70 factor (ECF subfamily)
MSTTPDEHITQAAGPAELSKARVPSRLGDLLEQSAAGDTAAFATLYAETAPRAFGLALRVVRNRGLAEEVTQDAYLKIWHTAGRFDQREGSCQGWIFTIVHRVAIDLVRSSQARSVRDDRHHRESVTQDHADDDPTHELAHASLEATLALEAMSCLSGPQRQALELAYFDGHTYSQVAGLLGIPLGTAKSRIRDGLLRLRESLTRSEPPLVEP